jgi:hypothetical protein
MKPSSTARPGYTKDSTPLARSFLRFGGLIAQSRARGE